MEAVIAVLAFVLGLAAGAGALVTQRSQSGSKGDRIEITVPAPHSGQQVPLAPPPLRYSVTASLPGATASPPYSPDFVDLERFNALIGDAAELGWVGQPLRDMGQLFIKSVILDDDTTLAVETVKVPGFIGVSNAATVTAPDGQTVSGHDDVAQVLARDGLLVCTFQWHKERYGIPIDTRTALDTGVFQEAFLKNEAHHVGTLVPAQRPNADGVWVPSYAAHNEPGSYHEGMYGDDGFVAVAQRLLFPEFMDQAEARGYTDSIICWMGLLNPFVKFPKNYNGGDPTRVGDRATLRSFLGYGLRAALGDRDAVRFLNDPINMTYCGEFIYVALNTVLHPFNRAGLTELLDGDAAAAEEILSLQARHNRREPTILSQKSEDAEFEALLNRTPSNPEFDAFHIGMPVVPENLLPLDQALARQGYPVPTGSLPLPPFTLSQLIRRAFRTMLPRHQGQQGGPELAAKVAAAQARVLGYLEQAIVQQLGLDAVVPETDPRRRAAHRFVQIVQQQLERPFDSQAALNQTVDSLVAKVDEMLVGYGDRTRFAPPRIYTDLGQQDGDPGLPQGWGFQLETVGALVARNVLGDPAQTQAKAWRTIEVRSPYLRGDDVQLCQGALIRRGFSVKADGIFGPASAEVVKEFQQGQGLEPTGSIDEATRQRLLAVDS